MTDEEALTLRAQAMAVIATARKKVNPPTTAHIAEVAKPHADAEVCAYAELVGWKMLVGQYEEGLRATFRPTRSGHNNASGRYAQLRSILNMPERIGDLAKDLGELTLPELRQVIDAYERRASDNQAEADRLRRIADAMEKDGAEIVAELGEERVLGIYTGETSNA